MQDSILLTTSKLLFSRSSYTFCSRHQQVINVPKVNKKLNSLFSKITKTVNKHCKPKQSSAERNGKHTELEYATIVMKQASFVILTINTIISTFGLENLISRCSYIVFINQILDEKFQLSVGHSNSFRNRISYLETCGHYFFDSFIYRLSQLAIKCST